MANFIYKLLNSTREEYKLRKITPKQHTGAKQYPPQDPTPENTEGTTTAKHKTKTKTQTAPYT
jgi:hypothetical protein